MAIVQISSTLDGEATVVADATATFAAESTQAGSSTQAAAATEVYAADSAQAGSSTQTSDATAAYAAGSVQAGSSNQASEATATYAGDSLQAGSSTKIVGASALYAADSTLAGGSALSSSATLVYEAAAELSAESTMGADAEDLIGASMAAASSMSATAGVLLGAEVELASESSFDAAPSVEAEAELGGAANLSANAGVFKNNTAIAAGASGMSAAATVELAVTSTAVGGSSMAAVANYATLSATCTMSGFSDMTPDASFSGTFGEDGYGGSPYGGIYPSYGLESALALSSTQVRIRYTAMFDPGFPLLLSISNYSVSPPVTVNSIVLESAQSVLINTGPLTAPVYTVAIADARGYFDQPLYPPLNSAQFSGVAAEPSFYAAPSSDRRVRAVFSVPMFLNIALTDPAQYVLTDFSGAPVTVTSVTTEQLADVRSTVLHLGESLVDERHYRLTVLSGIVSQELAPVSPDTSVFQWVRNTLRASIPVSEFSGEVMNGLYGIHGGLVFFSPALETSTPNSIIQVQQVDVCTRAYDEYQFPRPVGSCPLMTHGAGVVSTPTLTTLNSTEWVLWASFPRLVDARFELAMTALADTVPPPTDGPAAATLTETWPPNRISLLNNTDWKLFDNLGDPPAYFIAADNLTPFPPGTSVITILSMEMTGGSTQEFEAT